LDSGKAEGNLILATGFKGKLTEKENFIIKMEMFTRDIGKNSLRKGEHLRLTQMGINTKESFYKENTTGMESSHGKMDRHMWENSKKDLKRGLESG